MGVDAAATGKRGLEAYIQVIGDRISQMIDRISAKVDSLIGGTGMGMLSGFLGDPSESTILGMNFMPDALEGAQRMGAMSKALRGSGLKDIKMSELKEFQELHTAFGEAKGAGAGYSALRKQLEATRIGQLLEKKRDTFSRMDRGNLRLGGPDIGDSPQFRTKLTSDFMYTNSDILKVLQNVPNRNGGGNVSSNTPTTFSGEEGLVMAPPNMVATVLAASQGFGGQPHAGSGGGMADALRGVQVVMYPDRVVGRIGCKRAYGRPNKNRSMIYIKRGNKNANI